MPDFIAALLPILIKVAQEIIDIAVNGATLTEHQIMALKSAKFELELWGRHLAKDTLYTWDDEAVEAFIKSIDDTLAEANQ